MKKTTTADLQDTLRGLLAQGGATHTQTELMQALVKAGFPVNQTKVSRLLRKMGAIKTINQAGIAVYQLPWEPIPPSTKTALAHLVIDVVRNESLIFVRCSPGSTSLFARIIDHAAEELGVLASVAGDDTLLVAPRSVKAIEETLLKIKTKLFS